MPVKKIESEKFLERKLAKAVKDNGGISFKLLSQHHRGLPDRMNLFPGGNIFFAEIKTTGKKATRLQLVTHQIFRELGFNVYLIDSSEGIKRCLKEMI